MIRNRKKSILLAAACVCLLTTTAFGTLAYFTAKGEAENTFMVAGYDPENPDKPIDPDDLFSVTVTETTPEDDPDIEKDPNGNGNIYKNIIPGDKLPKDPTVTNTGKYSQWVRVKVTLTNAANWKSVLGDNPNGLFTASECGFDTAKWTSAGDPVTEDDTLTWTYYLNTKLDPAGTAVLFTNVVIPGELNVEDMTKLASFKLSVAAEAIQSENTGETPQAAFVLYDAQETQQP